MKVMCIKYCSENDKDIIGVPCPEVGDKVTVINEKMHLGKSYYQFSEYPKFNGFNLWFNANNFVRIDTDLDETILVNEEWEQKVCEPINR